jgi:hypothetical protein
MPKTTSDFEQHCCGFDRAMFLSASKELFPVLKKFTQDDDSYGL